MIITGDYVDLLIARRKTINLTTTIVFEGKGDGCSTWDRVLSQLQEYAETYVGCNGRFLYMIGAMGMGCRFFMYRKGDAMEMTYMVYKATTRRVSYLDSGRATAYDISTDQAAISYFMDGIRAHATPL